MKPKSSSVFGFPAQLRTMFLEQNGGSLRGQHQESFHDIRRIGGTGLRIEVNDPWWLDQDYWQPDPPLHLLVPMCGDGHNDICLDYRGCGPTGEPEVWMIRQGGPEYMISHSFDEYLAHTVVHAATRIVSKSTDVETVADRLAAALDTSVNHYSPFSRVNARRGLVVQNNRVEGDGLTGNQFRVPEHPFDAVLVQCNVDDGTLDFVPPRQWRESQPAITAAIAEAYGFVTECLEIAELR